jgi:hypothetical protein
LQQPLGFRSPESHAVIAEKLPMAVEKLPFRPKQPNWGDRKCLGKLRRSFVAHPDAILFLRISGQRVFQQPRLISSLVAIKAASD